MGDLFSRALADAFAHADARTLAKAKLMPVVVHLNGSPLMGLPSIDREGALWGQILDRYANIGEAEAKWREGNHDPRLYFKHAVLFSEYDSVRQNALELYRESNSGRFGLPADLANWSETPRFWMLMGVQLGDTAVRQRLITQILAPISLMDSNPRTLQPSWRTGVTINTRISEEDRDLLYWSGFDVAKASAQDMLGELEKYVVLLRSAKEEVDNVR